MDTSHVQVIWFGATILDGILALLLVVMGLCRLLVRGKLVSLFPLLTSMFILFKSCCFCSEMLFHPSSACRQHAMSRLYSHGLTSMVWMAMGWNLVLVHNSSFLSCFLLIPLLFPFHWFRAAARQSARVIGCEIVSVWISSRRISTVLVQVPFPGLTAASLLVFYTRSFWALSQSIASACVIITSTVSRLQSQPVPCHPTVCTYTQLPLVGGSRDAPVACATGSCWVQLQSVADIQADPVDPWGGKWL